MHASIAKKLAKKMKRQSGFTLLEILVVLTIMGFLIAMVAPRLAGISGGAVDTVCDSNQQRMISMMSGYFEKTNRYPDKLTNIVEETNDNAYQIPAVSDNNPENGPETLASEFNERNRFAIHYLNADEVLELKNMGIVNVFNLNSYDGIAEGGLAIKSGYTPPTGTVYNDIFARAPKMEQVSLNSTMAVMMIGCGSTSNTANATMITADERGWGEGDFLGRIVLGFGPENGLVTSGIISNAAHCPGGIQNADNVTYNDYNLVLPRLKATVERFDTAIATTMDRDKTKAGVQLGAVAYGDTAPGAGYDYDDNAANFKTRTFDLVAQETYQYATMCPEGHKFPADDDEFWGLDINGNDLLN